MTFDTDPRAVWARFALARAALDKVTAGLRRQGVDVLAVKGVVTSAWLYVDRADRPLRDVDVRIRPRDFGAAIRAAKVERWQTDRCVWTYRNLIVRVDGLSIDVESYVGSPFVSALSVERMFDRATRDPAGHWVPDIHDHAVLLTVNLFKDKLTCTAPWATEDVRRVVLARGFEPGVYVSRVREAALAGPAWVVADWMARHVAQPEWAEVRRLLGGDTPRRARYASTISRLFSAADPASLGVRVLTRMASDSPQRWPLALALSAAWEVESTVDLRRRGRRSQ